MCHQLTEIVTPRTMPQGTSRTDWRRNKNGGGRELLGAQSYVCALEYGSTRGDGSHYPRAS